MSAYPTEIRLFIADSDDPAGNITVADFANDAVAERLSPEEALWVLVQALQNNNLPHSTTVQGAINRTLRSSNPRTADLATVHWLTENRHRS